MQITLKLKQAEIEAAILAYIGNEFTLRNGGKLSVELVATRGEGGFTALIETVASTEATAPTVAIADKPIGGFKLPASLTTAVSVAQGPSLNTVLSSGLVPSSPAEVRAMMESEPEPANDTVAMAATGVVDAQTVEDAPASKPKSLFQGLKRPVNA